MAADPSGKDVAGCFTAVLYLFFVQPMWYVLMFGVLSRIETPVWMWVLYWCYVPFGFVTTAFAHIWRALDS